MMGARVTRVFSNFNLESRAHREISKVKPSPAPQYPSVAPAQEDSSRFQEEIKKKDEHLHTLLKEVYVDSKDPVTHVKDKEQGLLSKQEERRLAKVGHFSPLDVQTVPKGKISIAEALNVLSNHALSPTTWTAEKIASEYSLELKDVTAVLTFFIPFSKKIVPVKDRKSLQSKEQNLSDID
uniref:NADH dehydrogenase [ubiquinone] 1 alpha subcomplex assembly factor 4 n=1 Tax=Salvator merianae TaxID=96440 RepID=A0A8D0BWS5_SALMN